MIITENLESWNLRIKSDPKDFNKNSLLQKAVRKVAIIVRINFFRTLRITQKFASIQEVFIQEKWRNLHKKELCGVLTCLRSILCSLVPH